MNKEFEKFIEQIEKINDCKRKVFIWSRKELEEFCDKYFSNDTEFAKLLKNIYQLKINHKTMQTLTTILVSLVALEHLYILYMECLFWETLSKKTFKGSLPDELFLNQQKLAANQGLYNGFLSAGLIWRAS